MKQVWKVTNMVNGFKVVIMVRGTEAELQDYIKSELSNAVKYVGAMDAEVKAAELLGMPIYMA